jgi:hypothetical protein
MLPSTKLLGALNGLRPDVSNTLTPPRAAAPQADGSEEVSEQAKGATWTKLEEPALDQLLSRAEVEMSEPKAIQRQATIAHLKLAAVNTRR